MCSVGAVRYAFTGEFSKVAPLFRRQECAARLTAEITTVVELTAARTFTAAGRLRYENGVSRLNAAKNTPAAATESAGRCNELEQRIQALERELTAANAGLDNFSYSVSHDLRAPLRHITAFSQILRAEHAGQLSSAGVEVVDRIVRSAQRMSRMIDGMLELARHSQEAIEHREIDMNELVRDELGARAGELANVQLEVGELPACTGDRVLLARVWSNLIGNALKFSARSPGPRVAIDGVAAEAEACYCVRDNGVGFDMKYADQLFGMFHRLHASSDFDGVGVGLAIVQKIVERHGGRIWTDARVNGGATFCFALPHAAAG